MNAAVYEIRNTANSKRYIGSSKSLSRRWQVHKRDLRIGTHHSRLLQNAWRKYGAEAFEFRILLICDQSNRLMYEQLCLDNFLPEYNVAKFARTPMLGFKHSVEAKAKLSAALKGRVFSKEHIANISRHKKTPEHRAALAAARLGRKLSEETKWKIGCFSRGKPWTAERRAAQPKKYNKQKNVRAE